MPDSSSSAAKPWLDALNPAQLEAVTTLDGPLLVLSGAGTGKTRVLTSRVAELIHSGKAMPWNILAVTFTNKAAREMKERANGLAGPAAHNVSLGTFHSLCGVMLRRHAELANIRSDFTILGTDDQNRVMKAIMEGHGLDIKRWPPRLVCSVIQRWKDRVLPPDKVKGRGEFERMDIANGRMVQLYEEYQGRLLSLNAVDFGDLLLHVILILQRNPDIQTEYHRKITHLMVDEYQDTNVAQYLWLRLLTGPERNLCCVGDDDQSIYGWRGAEVGNILKFEKDFKGAKVVRLEQNYRSTGHILDAASCVIANNTQRFGKSLHTSLGSGEKLHLMGYWDGRDEARGVSARIESLSESGVDLSQIAVLVRAGFQTREFEDRFISMGMPYKVVGTRFYERAEIRDAIAYLRLVAQPADDLALERIINVPRRGIGDASVSVIREHARKRDIPMLEAAGEIAGSDRFRPRTRKAVGDFTRDVMRWRDKIESTDHPGLARSILEEAGYIAMQQSDKSPEAEGRLENLAELVSAMHEFESLAGFLEHVALVMDGDSETNRSEVSLMTIHAAKGLEFDAVFLPGWEEDVFPIKRSIDEVGLDGLEEERRLAYVAMTRARKHLFISFAASRMVHGQWVRGYPSMFIRELPSGAVVKEGREGVGVPFPVTGEESETPLEGESTDTKAQDAQPIEARQDIAQQSYGPGWRRMMENDRPSSGQKFGRQSRGEDFAVADRVFHQKFGMGRVSQVSGTTLGVEFDKAGYKKVVADFVKKQTGG